MVRVSLEGWEAGDERVHPATVVDGLAGRTHFSSAVTKRCG
jgi:hypothetical protein